MIKLKPAIVTEGRYDKARLANIFDAPIIETGGFGIYKNAAKRELIKTLAVGDGVVIITDPDKAGFRIRNYIKNFCAGGKIWDVYLPDVPGKERRKRAPSGEGLLGAEGLDDAVIIEAFRRAGVGEGEGTAPFTKAFLTELGLCGGANSAALRASLAARLALPANMNANTLARVLPRLVTADELRALVAELRG